MERLSSNLVSRVKRSVKSLKLRLVARYFKASPYKNGEPIGRKKVCLLWFLALVFWEIILDQLCAVLFEFGPFTVKFKRSNRAGRHIHTA